MMHLLKIVIGFYIVVSITACSDDDIIELFDQGQEQALIRAILDDDKRRVQLLVDEDVSLNISGADKSSPLYWAVAKKEFNMATYLMENGADPYQEMKDGHTILTMAAVGHSWALRFLLSSGVNPNSSGGFGRSATCWAISRMKWENLDLLFEAGADVNYKGPDKLSVAECAASVGRYDKVLDFFEMGFSTNLEALAKWAGRRASRNYEKERAQVVYLLREKGVDVEIKPFAPLPNKE